MARTESVPTCTVTTDSQPGATVFLLTGVVTAATAADVRLELRSAIGPPAVLLDLSAVQFIDSIGFGSLVWVLRKIHEHEGLVTITGADARRGVAAALSGAGLDQVVHLAGTNAEGLAWLLSARDPVSPG